VALVSKLQYHESRLLFWNLFQESGCLVWEYNIGDPITASAYIDENLHFESHELLASDRY